MSEKLTEDLQETQESLKAYARKLTNMIDIMDRTMNNPAATNNSAMDLVAEFKQHPWVMGSKLGVALTGVHKALFRDANAKLDAKIAADREALKERNPIKITKKT